MPVPPLSSPQVVVAYAARGVLRGYLGDSMQSGGGVPFWRCAFGVGMQLGVLPALLAALCASKGGGSPLFPTPRRLERWNEAWLRTPSGVWEWAFGYVFGLFFTFDLLLVPMKTNVLAHHVVCLAFHGWVFFSPQRPGLQLVIAGEAVLEFGTGGSNLSMLLPGSDAVRAFFVLAMSASNTYGAVLTVRWLRLQRGRWVWLTLLPTILGILALRQLHVVNEVYKRAHSPAPP